MNETTQPAVAGPVEPKVRQHTPGPWRVNAWQLEADGATIADLYSWAEDTMAARAEAEANAVLIQTAPDLLKALERLLASADVRDAADPDALTQARAAIAKAVGSAA